MNVEVLGGDNIYYGSMNTILQKQRQRAALALKQASRHAFGDDELLGFDWASLGKGISNVAGSVVKAFKSPTGKAIGSAALVSVAGRLTPTQKAQVATVQEAAGMSPQVITGGGNTNVAQPVDNSMSKNLPLILGGVAILGLFAVVALKK